MKMIIMAATAVMAVTWSITMVHAANPPYRGEAPPPPCAVVYTLNDQRNDLSIIGKRESGPGAIEYTISVGGNGFISATAYHLDTGVWILKWSIPGEASGTPFEKIVVYPWPFSWAELTASATWERLNPAQRHIACRRYYDLYASRCGESWEDFQRSEQNCD
jgi:hypothetical protein